MSERESESERRKTYEKSVGAVKVEREETCEEIVGRKKSEENRVERESSWREREKRCGNVAGKRNVKEKGKP
jgi:hypothetical protein